MHQTLKILLYVQDDKNQHFRTASNYGSLPTKQCIQLKRIKMNSNKILLIVLLSAAFTGCQKDDAGKTVATQEVSFGIDLMDIDGLKSGVFECQFDDQGNPLIPTVLEIDITDLDIGTTSTFNPQIFMLDGKLYSQAIKLATGQYSISKFLMLTEIGGTVVMAIPEASSEFGQYVVNGVDFEFEVGEFSKTQVDVQVLCFSLEKVDEFGFFWFQTNEIVIREQCFFGDLCLKDPTDYAGSYYDDLFAPLSNYPFDLPAIYKIEVIRNNGDWSKSFTNIVVEDNVATEFIAPLCIKYPDRVDKDDEFVFKLYIYVRVGSQFQYKYFHSWTIVNDESFDSGNDGIMGFVVGNCNYNGADLQLAPYQNLPTSASITISSPGDPGYWNLNVNSVNPAGNYDLPLGEMTGWCGDQETTIIPGTKNMYIYSSLYSTNWPAGMPFNPQDIAKVNWLFNNLGNFAGFNTPTGNVITSNDITQAQGLLIQDAIWEIIHGNTGISGMAMDMATAAANQGNFSPLPGGWAAILCVAFNKPVQHQLIFTVVDP
jgi:hypothetical protein